MADPDPTRSARTRGIVLAVSVGFVTLCSIVGFFGSGRRIIVVQPGGATFDDRVLPVFFLAFFATAIVSWRWPRIGGVLALFVVAGFVPFAVNQLEPWSAVVVIAAFGIPALLWTALGATRRTTADPDLDPDADPDDAPDLGRRRFLLTVAGGVVAVVAGSSIGRYVYDRVWGPTHPESDVAPLPDSPVQWAWCGAVTSTGCVVRARARRPFEEATLVIARDAQLGDARRVELLELYDRVTHFLVDDLEPDTRYWYALELDGEIDRVRIGSFRTFPDVARPLRLAFGSCARTGSNGAVFDAIRAADPDLYACIGDFHYGDIFVDDIDDYRQVFDVQLTRPAQAALYASAPIAYVWDDHDYGPNDSNADAPGRNAAMVAFREYVPHYELAGPESAVFQAFSIGSVRVIMTDARSARDPQSDPDSIDKSMLGEEQRRWLLDELSNSAPDHDVVIWVNPVPWVDPAEPGADSWAGYDAERRLIAQHIVDEGIDHLVMVAGDAHMVAIDDGTHTDYADAGGRGFPLIHVAALDRPGSTKGGPYTQGPITGGGHFALVEVTPTDTGVDVTLAAKDWRGDDLLRHEVSFPRRTTS